MVWLQLPRAEEQDHIHITGFHPEVQMLQQPVLQPDLILSRLRMQMVVHVHPAQRLQNLQQLPTPALQHSPIAEQAMEPLL